MLKDILFCVSSLLKDALELGAVFIGSEARGYSVRESVPKGTLRNKWRCGVVLQTPDRQFVFMCEREQDQREWIKAFREVMALPMLPQHYACKRRNHSTPTVIV